MREPELRHVVRGVALAAAITVASVMAPNTANAQEPAAQPVQTTTTDDRDDDRDWGWLGLLGLAGLLGLRKRDHVHHVDTTTRRP